MAELKDTKFFIELEKRNSENSKIYTGKLLETSKDIRGFLEFIKTTFPDFPDHSIQHSFRILDYVGKVLGEQISQLTDTEIFCFILSTLFHDTGMSLVGFSTKNAMRSQHPENASIVIDKYFDESFPKFKSKDRLKSIIKYVSLSHGLDIDFMYKDPNFSSIDTINGDNVRNSILSVLIRIGDLLDLDDERTNWLALYFFPSIFSVEAKAHNLRHLKVQKYHYDSTTLNVEVIAQNITEYKIWSEWLGYLEKEILYANTRLKQENIFFPALTKSIKKDENADFDIEDIRFELDDKGGIWEIISKSIYTDKFDFIREVIQNAIDATLSNIYLNENISIAHASPRSWILPQHTAPIYICYSAKNKLLYIIDSGIGMNAADLRQFLFKVSGTGNRDTNKRNFIFPSIAKYGIGFVSCIINAEKIEVYTAKENEKHLYKVTLETGINQAFIEKLPYVDYIGTSLAIKLKEQFAFKNIHDYIYETFRYPSVELRCIDLDTFIVNAKALNINDAYTSCVNTPYKLINSIENLNHNREKAMKPIAKKLSELHEIQKDADKLIDWIKINQEYTPELPDEKKFIIFKNMIKEMRNKLPNPIIKDNYPFSATNINQKELFNESDEYIYKIEQFIEFINQHISKQATILKKYPSFYNKIHKNNLCFDGEWEYIIADLDDDLEICSIEQHNTFIDLSNRTGILVIKHAYQDYDIGIEYSTVNGFIINKGVVTTQLTQLKGYHTVLSENKRPKNIILGSYDSYGNIRDMLSSELFDMSDYDEEAYYLEADDEFIPGMTFEPTSNIIKIVDNKFILYSDVPTDLIDNFSDPTNKKNLLQTIHPIESKNFPETLDELRKIDIVKSSYYQDGIHIPFEIDNLFPIGFSKIICNTTCSSRISLNVTRHEVSRIKSDIDTWYNNTGKIIQNQIFLHVSSTLKKLKLDVNFQELIEIYWAEKNENTFGIECKSNLIKFSHENK